MKRKLVKVVGTILLAAAAMLVALPACGGSTGGSAPVPSVPGAKATGKQPAIPVPTATVAPAPATSSTSPPSSDLLAQGKLVFEKTAGGVGCALCHGLDGKGGGAAGLGAPDIRGKTEAKVRGALIGGVPLMSFIKLSEEEITAVAAYVQWLDTQP